jgi:hypothetical protein
MDKLYYVGMPVRNMIRALKESLNDLPVGESVIATFDESHMKEVKAYTEMTGDELVIQDKGHETTTTTITKGGAIK